MSVPIALSPGRSGFGPQLSLSYDSGSGNSPFGFGWNLSLPAITRKTDKGLPQYMDARDSDVFVLSGAEDLVPVYRQAENGEWLKDDHGIHRHQEESMDGYQVRRYRPRMEGLFARIERWTHETIPGKVHWRSISKDNILTLYGLDDNSRISDPLDRNHVFTWLICETRDDKGNAILYRYKEEDGRDVDLGKSSERNRGEWNDTRRASNRYLKHIYYGNRLTLLDAAHRRPRFLDQALLDHPETGSKWMFEAVFDYGDHAADVPKPQDGVTPDGVHPLPHWPCRPDSFSHYRAGFEIRTMRLCKRVLMFHHFPGDAEVDIDCLVRSTDFIYSKGKTPTEVGSPVYTFLDAVSHTGYQRNGNGYSHRSLPPLEFHYTKPIVQDAVHEVDPQYLGNLPLGVDGIHYQWTDLHGEGIPGILTEQAGAWFYQHNLSPISANPVEFGPLERVAAKPNLAIAGGMAQFMDLAGNGKPDLVVMNGPMAGLYEHDEAEGWESFRPFTSRLNRDMSDPNLRFIDLDGDGHADILITENDALVWHASLAEAGFGAANRVAQALDEEKGPRVVFADGSQSIYLADFSGDGLTDVVRLRNGEVCYWPNLGYGRFGAKITMDQGPLFDNPDQFDHRRIRLADIDGSGTTDIIYLHRDGIRLYFNQSGNGWSQPQTLRVFPRVDDIVSIVPTDLLGNGTACLVWSSPLPGDAGSRMRYVNLMGEQKPHLLIKTINNLGGETQVDYAPSTRFYLADKRAGKPWITKLPFPVHVVVKVAVIDTWRKTRFATQYSYHHGYFDGIEREFRGFGRVEQTDIEHYEAFAEANRNSPYVTADPTLYQPPVKTITWYHTGAFLDRQRILSHNQNEYFPSWFEAKRPDAIDVLNGFHEHGLPETDTLDSATWSSLEWREALRACKGMVLRQEVYELDVKAFHRNGEHLPATLYSTAFHNCNLRLLQPKGENPHAVFLATESESIAYQYELSLRADALNPDPRIAHTLNLSSDKYGNVLQSISVVYGRLRVHRDPGLPDGTEALIAEVQSKSHLAYTENRFTNSVLDQTDDYRLCAPCEVRSHELTGVSPKDRYFSLSELRDLSLSENQNPDYLPGTIPVLKLKYHERPSAPGPMGAPIRERRLVEHVRLLYLAANLEEPLEFSAMDFLGLPYETYKLALTEELLSAVFGPKITPAIHDEITNPARSGYLNDQDPRVRYFGTSTQAGQYWIRSGIAGFTSEAAANFYLPDRYEDPFGNFTYLEYDRSANDLYIKSSTDAAGNTVSVEKFDFRVLAPRLMRDLNDNLSEVVYDILGMPTAMAVLGKGTEADNLIGSDFVLINPSTTDLISVFASQPNRQVARQLLGNATSRTLYHFGESYDVTGKVSWATRPAGACAILRERHVADIQAQRVADNNPGFDTPLQMAFECSDGHANVLLKRNQAEPDPLLRNGPLRWIVNGKTIVNNKGKAVKQYEPYFSAEAVCRGEGDTHEEVGVTPILFYDATGRLVRTEMPDGTFSRVEFSPWHVISYDANDTVLESKWYQSRNPPDAAQPLTSLDPDRRAAWLAAQHADTPATTFLDSLGREVIAVTYNRTRFTTDIGPGTVEKTVTFTKMDAEGKPLWIRDARRNLVMQYIQPPMANDAPIDSAQGFTPCYDIAGNLLFQHSMDAGDRWILNDAAGKPMFAWDFNERQVGVNLISEGRLYFTKYDSLHRPGEQWLSIDSGAAKMTERFEYQDAQPNDANNLNGQLIGHYDSAGRVEMVRRDFKGNVLEIKRRLNNQPTESLIDWQGDDPADKLETETFRQLTVFDALNRMTMHHNWHREGLGKPVAKYAPTYNERGLLVSEKLTARLKMGTAGIVDDPKTKTTSAIKEIRYNVKGQKDFLKLGNGTVTHYDYDEKTFRLRQLRTTRPNYNPGFPRYRSGLNDLKVLQQLHYTYDPVGNITEIYDEAYEPVFFQNQHIEPRSRFEYDALYRLISAQGREDGAFTTAPKQLEGTPHLRTFANNETQPGALRPYTQTYRYDSAGNIEQMSHQAGNGSWTREYAYAFDDPTQAASNRLWRTWQGDSDWNSGSATNKVTYVHDTHGNMRNLDQVAADKYLRWDHRDMIGALDLGGGGTAFYQYDGDKQRTRKRIVNQNNLGGYWERIYLGGYELYRRYDSTGTSLVEEVESLHLFEGEQRVLLVDDVIKTDRKHGNGTAFKEKSIYRYQYSNHLGSACLELDDVAGIISYEEYHPYGTSAYRTMKSGVEASPNRYRYTGMERDQESGLSYQSARYMSFVLCRWVQVDPAGLIDGNNVYLYARNNPTVFNDPTGLACQETDLKNGWHCQSYTIFGLNGSQTTVQLHEKDIDPSRDATYLGSQGRLPQEGMMWREGISTTPPPPEQEEPFSQPPLVEAVVPPPPRPVHIDFDDDLIEGDPPPVPEDTEFELDKVESKIKKLDPVLKKSLEDAKSESLGVIPVVGWIAAALYDFARGDNLGGMQNIAEEGVEYFAEKSTKEAIGVIPIVGQAYDSKKLHDAMRAAGENVKKMKELKKKRYRLKDKLGQEDARYDLEDGRTYLGPGGRLYDRRTGKPMPNFQGR